MMPFVNKLIKIIKTLARRVFTAEKNAERLLAQTDVLKASNEKLKKRIGSKNWS